MIADPARSGSSVDDRPCVSVLMIAYNVEEYIGQALESVLMQEVSFRYEIVVGEDCSTDRTREILTEYRRQHPDKIRLILRERNLGMNANFFATFSECRGRYIALLDGDDYWKTPQKLQKQVDFLESHPECTICFHNAMVVYEDGTEEPHPYHVEEPRHRISTRIPKGMSGLEEIALHNFMQTCSVVYRADVVREVPDWCSTMPTFDWPLHVLHAEHGKIGYLDEVLGTYRVHAGGFWSAGMSRYHRLEDVETMIRAHQTIDRHLGFRFHEQIRRALPYLYDRAVEVSIQAGHRAEARRYAMKFLWSSAPRFGWKQKRALRLIVRTLLSDAKRRLLGVWSAIARQET